MRTGIKGVQKEQTRHGATVYYYRRPRGQRVRLPDDFGSTNFRDAVKLAATLGVGIPGLKKPTKAQTNRQRVGKALAQAIDRAKRRAGARGFGYDITLDWLLDRADAQDLRCALTGIPFYFGDQAKARDPFGPSIDRIDSAKGYTRDNVRIVVYAINVMLLDWGPGVMERVIMGYRAQARRDKKRTAIPAPAGPMPAPKN